MVSEFRARAYLSPSAARLWRWTDDGRVLVTGDGRTIAFREEIVAVLERLQPRGLPPFDQVVFVLAACQGVADWSSVPAIPRSDDLFQRVIGVAVTRVAADAAEAARLISSLPADVRTGLRPKTVLVEAAVSRVTHRTTPEEAIQVIHALREALPVEAEPAPASTNLHASLEDSTALVDGVRNLTADGLRLRARTGLDEPVRPADAVVEGARDLIEALLKDPEFSGLGSLARDLMAAVHIPRPISDPEEIPVGGFSDITTKGSLDRLLPSELAHDDLTFSARVALGEALYLRRETPPVTAPVLRSILIDAGIRLWGVPRLFAAAVALALAATVDRRTDVAAWRAAGDRLDPVDLKSRAGIVEHLEALRSEPHPGAALARFLEVDGEAVLVTHEDAFADLEFRRALADRPIYVATVARDGAFRLWTTSSRGKKLIREAKLDLSKIYPPARADVEIPDGDLPAFFSLSIMPLLVPAPVDPQSCRPHPRHGVIAVTRDGRVLHFDRPGRGPREVFARLPRGRLLKLDIDDEGRVAALLSTRNCPVLFETDLFAGEAALLELRGAAQRPLPTAGWILPEFVALAFPGRIRVLHRATGSLAREIEVPPHVGWVHGRFFFRGADWFALVVDAQSTRLEPVESGLFLHMWDREGHDGPWVLSPRGVANSTVPGGSAVTLSNFPDRPQFLQASHDGHRIAVKGPQRSAPLVYDLETGRLSRPTGDWRKALEPEVNKHTASWMSIRRKPPRTIFVDREGLLSLENSRGAVRRLVGGTGWSPGQDAARGVKAPFRRIQPPAGMRIDLRRADWPDGAAAWFDGRGLLHLRSADRALPELTIVLCDHEMAGWSSADGLFGSPALTGRDGGFHFPTSVWTALKTFCARLP